MAGLIARHVTRISHHCPPVPVPAALPKRYLSLSQAWKACFYTDKHEWVSIENGAGTVGISHYAQEQLGEIVFVEMPEVGTDLTAQDVAGCVESVKAASEIYSPVAGKVTEVNTEVVEQPGLVNSSPMDKGWLFKLQLPSGSSTDGLMDEAAYKKFVGTLE